jgi:GTPase SAR1 family protein
VTSRESFNAIEWWFTERSQHASAQAVKMIVGNKSDKVSDFIYFDHCICGVLK